MAKRERCLICGSLDPDKHHVKTRKSGGTDDYYNLVPLCRKHHSEIHQIGTSTFADKYDKFKNWLIAHDWQYNSLLNKWRH